MPPREPDPRNSSPAMDTSELAQIVTDLEEASNSLSPEERAEYEDAQRSVVEARFETEPPEGHVRLL